MKFKYKAIDSSGKQVEGTIDAETINNAKEAVSDLGLIPVSVSATADFVKSKSPGGGFLSRFMPSVKADELILFTKQFRSMYAAGIPILRVLTVLVEQTENKTLRNAISQIAEDVQKGVALNEAMAKFPNIFDNLYCSMIRAGEISGNVPEVMDRLIYIIEHEYKVKSDIKSAMQYPKIVLIALSIAFVILLTFVIPKFAVMFQKANITLPLPTRMAIWLYEFLKSYWALIAVTVIGSIYAIKLYVKTPIGKFNRDSLVLRIPIFGKLFIKAAMSRFASIFAILQSSGVPVMQSFTILASTIGNEAIAKAFEKVRGQLEEGKGIATPLNQAKFFPPMVVDMIAVGEESGNLDAMLQEITHHYDYEVKHAISRLSDAIGPVLIVSLAAVVGFFALAIFMPMWDLTKMAK